MEKRLRMAGVFISTDENGRKNLDEASFSALHSDKDIKDAIRLRNQARNPQNGGASQEA